jgi:hypothetical protein
VTNLNPVVRILDILGTSAKYGYESSKFRTFQLFALWHIETPKLKNETQINFYIGRVVTETVVSIQFWFIFVLYFFCNWFVFDLYSLYIWFIFGLYLVCIFFIFGLYLVYIWSKFGLHLVCIMFIFGLYLVYIWLKFGLYLVYILFTIGLYLTYIRFIFGL